MFVDLDRFFYGLTTILYCPSANHELLIKARQLRQMAQDQLQRLPCDATVSKKEKMYGNELDKAVNYSNSDKSEIKIVVKKSIWLHGYEADLVLLLSNASGGSIQVLNIEIDGPSHYHPRTRRFSYWRDKYLSEEAGVVVERIDIMNSSNESVRQQLEHIVKMAKERAKRTKYEG